MYAIQIRKGNEYGEEMTMGQAVEHARGGDRDFPRISVTAVYIERVVEPGFRGRKDIVHEPGSPVFGMDAEVHGRRPGWGPEGTYEPAQVSMAAIGTHSPEVAMLRASIYMLAAQIASAANIEVPVTETAG